MNNSNIKKQIHYLQTIKDDREELKRVKERLELTYTLLAETGYPMDEIDTTDLEDYVNVYYQSIDELIIELEKEL